MADDIVLNKVKVIERCLKRVNEEYENDPENLKNYTKQDSIVLNIQRACEAAIDLAMHIVSQKGLGVPQNSRDAFELLYKHNIIDAQLSKRLKAMVGFRNIAVHDYQNIDLGILKKIIEMHLCDLVKFGSDILKL